VGSELARGLRNFLALPEEQRALGQYHLLHQLGSGGFAPVWLAAERYGSKELRKVAVKLFAIGAGEATREEMIIEEAQALCHVEHPNVVRFYTFSKDATNLVLGLVMEYVRGVSLDRRLEEREKLGYPEVVELGSAVASALEAVHKVGLIHRDLKPANVIVSEGVYKLIDFGIASADEPVKKAARPSRKVVLDDLPLEVAATKASMLAPSTLGGVHATDSDNPFAQLAGTLGYMDPRCVSAQERATPASDLYALGATLFECAVGMLPAIYAAKTSGGFGLKGEVLDGRSPSPSLAEAAPDAPPELVAIVDELLDPDPARRPASAGVVAARLSVARGSFDRVHVPVAAPAVGDSRSPPATTDLAFGTAERAPPPPPRSRIWLTAGVGGGLACAAALVLVLATRSHTPVAATAATMPTVQAIHSEPPREVLAALSASPVAPSAASASASAVAVAATRPAVNKLAAAPAHSAAKVAAPVAPVAAPPPAAMPSNPGGVVVQSPY
jgi:serine/threonine protein kinase